MLRIYDETRKLTLPFGSMICKLLIEAGCQVYKHELPFSRRQKIDGRIKAMSNTHVWVLFRGSKPKSKLMKKLKIQLKIASLRFQIQCLISLSILNNWKKRWQVVSLTFVISWPKCLISFVINDAPSSHFTASVLHIHLFLLYAELLSNCFSFNC